MGNTCSSDLIDFDSDPGYALILGYDEYKNCTEKRTGNPEDVKRLKSVLSSRRFDVTDELNLTVEETKQKIHDLANNDKYISYSSLVLIVMTHGTYGGLLQANDGYFRTEDIWKPLINSSNFKNKPKILIFQACRGDMRERLIPSGCSVQENDESSPSVQIELPKLPHDSNFFIAFSTVPNTFSISNLIEGSWYIQTLCAELESIKIAITLESLFTRITYMLVNNKSKGGHAQTPSFVSFLSQQLNVREAKGANKFTDQFSNSTLLVMDHASFSNELLSQDIAVDISDIAFDASGNVKTIRNVPSYYNWRHRMNGRAVIYYSQMYTNDANKLYTTLQRLNFNIDEPTLIEGDNFLNSIQNVSTDPELTDENCVLVAILATISCTSPTSQESHIAGHLISKTWTPFIASKCSYLHEKPKIFLYLDKMDTFDCCRTLSINEMDVTFDLAAIERNVTDHVDFIHIFGYGRAYFDALLSHLEIGFRLQNDLFEILTNAQNSALWNERGTSKIDTLPYFTSTLSLMMRLNNTPQIEDKRKSLSQQLSATNQDIVLDSGADEDTEIELSAKIDREVARVVDDGAQFVEKAATALPALQETFKEVAPQLKALFEVFRKSKK